ncbi:MAG: glycoside hydrolase family 27 protein [Lachnospiraceae bacterium]|jgi:alpha-galactosidase
MHLKKDDVAKRPPMGWNSWDNYASGITEKQLLDNAEQLSKLKRYGWEYVVCDIQWSDPLAGTESRKGIVYQPFAPLTLDAWGRQLPAPSRFPSAAGGRGFAPIAEKIHDMGLKFGIHIMRGIPRQAVHARKPVLGTNATADQIALPNSICSWNGDMYGVNPASEAGQAYYDSIFQLYAQWGVDFVKVDDICHEHLYKDEPYGEAEVEMIRRAMDRCGRPMVLSLSPGPALIEKAWHLGRNANMWRITDDFWDDWKLLRDMFERCELWQKQGQEGRWPDCDMLPFGVIGTGFEKARSTNFTREEQRTVMTLWCIFRSPLIMGGDLTRLDDWTRSLMTNASVLAAQQTGREPEQIMKDGNQAVWTSLAEDGGRYLALFNLSDEIRTVTADLSDLEFAAGQAEDLWGGRPATLSGSRLCVDIPPHGAAMYRLRR